VYDAVGEESIGEVVGHLPAFRKDGDAREKPLLVER
jgi:hypothetical protein